MTTEPTTVHHTYFEAWRNRDFAMLRAVLADDVTFSGPMGQVEGADEFRRSLERLTEMITDIDVRHVFADGPDILTWYEMHTKETEPLPVAHWLHVEDGRVTALRVSFDPRPLLPA